MANFYRRRFLLLSAFCGAVSGHAQTQYVDGINLMTTPTPGSGHDYIKMLDEIVNPANGSLSVRIEAPVPKQRGNTNFPYYVFSYNSTGVSFPTGWVGYASVGGSSQSSLNIQWQDSSTGQCATSVPGGIVANAGIGQVCSQYVSLFTQVLVNPSLTATCDYNTGFVYVDPSGSSHRLNLEWIVQNGASGGDEGCSWYGSAGPGVYTSGGDALYQASLYPPPGSQCMGQTCPQSPLYVANSHGQTSEDTNGNCCGPTGQKTVTNGKVTAVSILGLANPYSFTYGTANRSYTPGATLIGSVSSPSGCPSGFSSDISTKAVVKIITLPNGKQYQFQYDPSFGLLNKIIYPTGAWVSYTWAGSPSSESLGIGPLGLHCQYKHGWPYIQKRIVSFDGTNQALEQDFSYATTWGTGNSAGQWTQKTTTVTTKDLIRPGQPSFQTTYTYSAVPIFSFPDGQFLGQSAIESQIVYYDSSGAVLETVTKNWTTDSFPLLLSQCETLPNSGPTSGTFNTYGTLGVVTDKRNTTMALFLPVRAHKEQVSPRQRQRARPYTRIRAFRTPRSTPPPQFSIALLTSKFTITEVRVRSPRLITFTTPTAPVESPLFHRTQWATTKRISRRPTRTAETLQRKPSSASKPAAPMPSPHSPTTKPARFSA